jgi:cysteine synthase
MTKRLFREEAVMAGPSTGAAVEAAVALGVEGPAVAISADSGLKYASFFTDVLGDEGQPNP